MLESVVSSNIVENELVQYKLPLKVPELQYKRSLNSLMKYYTTRIKKGKLILSSWTLALAKSKWANVVANRKTLSEQVIYLIGSVAWAQVPDRKDDPLRDERVVAVSWRTIQQQLNSFDVPNLPKVIQVQAPIAAPSYERRTVGATSGRAEGPSLGSHTGRAWKWPMMVFSQSSIRSPARPTKIFWSSQRAR